ncbi:hypothetical protein ABK040_005042 [Willaertia magna]
MSQRKEYFLLVIVLIVYFFLSECSCYKFYLNQSHIDNDSSVIIKNCNSVDNPCNSHCEIINFINLNNNETNIEIYLLSDYNFNDNCDLIYNKKVHITFTKSENLKEIKINFQNELHCNNDIIADLNFYSLTLNNLKLNCNKIYFYYCNINNFKALSNIIINTLQFNNSNLNSLNIENVKNIIITNCNLFENFNFLNSANLIFKNLNVFDKSALSVKNCLNFNLFKGEFSEFSNLNLAYVGSVSLTNIQFNKTESIVSPLTIKFCPKIIIINCIAFTIYKFALLTGSDYVSINNLFTTGSFEILMSTTVELQNSQFKQVEQLGLRIVDVQKLDLFNVNFTKCKDTPLEIENINSRNLSVTIHSCYFNENKADSGAGLALMASIGSLEINNCNFLSNEAKYNGGALYLKLLESESIVTINNCKFIGNIAGIDIPKTSLYEGNGGAIYSVNTIPIISLSNNTFFLENKALTKSLLNLQNLLQQNSNEISSYIHRANVLYYRESEKLDSIKVFSSQSFRIILQAYDLIGNVVPYIYEPFEFIENSHEGFKLFQVSSSIYGEFKFLIMQLANYTFNEEVVKDKFSILFPITGVTVDFTIIDCPSGWNSVIVDNYKYCEKSEFPVSVIIVISVLGAVLFFLIGIGVGILIIYLVVRIMIKLKRLEKKEKAELDIERRIIDKKVVFGDIHSQSDMDIPLLESSEKRNKFEQIKKQEKFIIPVEEIKLERKIGEGGCGTVYSAKWGDNIVAIKTIRVSDDTEEEEEDFEREVSLLSSLRHPNIVTFYDYVNEAEIKVT